MQIEKNVKDNGGGARIKWPFADMEVDDSVLLYDHMAVRGQLYCHVYGRQTGRKFKTRKQTCGGVRVWRIE